MCLVYFNHKNSKVNGRDMVGRVSGNTAILFNAKLECSVDDGDSNCL